MSWAPLRYAVTRPLTRYADVRRLAERSWEIAPAIDAIAPPAVFDEDELARVVAVEPQTTLPYELSRVHGGRVRHAATRAHLLRDAVLAGSYVYARSSREQVAEPGATPWLPSARVQAVPRALFAGSVVASKYFGHWVTEQLTAEVLAGDLDLPAFRAIRQEVYPHERAIRDALGLDVRLGARVHFDELLVIDDYGQNESKRERYARLRAGLRREARPHGSRGVFIDRGATGARRRLANEQEIVESLVRAGFDFVRPDRDDLATIRDALFDAPIVVGVEGSALVHAIMMMPELGRLLVVEPPDRFNNVLKDYTDCLGMRYGFTVADPVADGFYLPEDRLLRAIDRLERA